MFLLLGRQVNLAPAARPQDVYSEVANLVEKKRKDDAKNGLLIAQQLEGKSSISFSQWWVMCDNLSITWHFVCNVVVTDDGINTLCSNPGNIYLFKVNNINFRKWCK